MEDKKVARMARKPYCPSCGRTRALFKYELEQTEKCDKLTMTCQSCGFKYYLYKKEGEKKWMRKKLLTMKKA